MRRIIAAAFLGGISLVGIADHAEADVLPIFAQWTLNQYVTVTANGAQLQFDAQNQGVASVALTLDAGFNYDLAISGQNSNFAQFNFTLGTAGSSAFKDFGTFNLGGNSPTPDVHLSFTSADVGLNPLFTVTSIGGGNGANLNFEGKIREASISGVGVPGPEVGAGLPAAMAGAGLVFWLAPADAGSRDGLN